MRNTSQASKVVHCSFCKMKIEGKGLEVMEFTFHPGCASTVGGVLAHVGKYRQWRTSHPTKLPVLVR